jgi:uncharacterized secreted protein with C-terminal beta-propeller domain
MKKQKLLFICTLSLAIMVLAGCTNPFARKQKPDQNPGNDQSINSILEKQGELKKFANEKEMKAFFENRPQNAGQAVSLNSGVASPVALGAKDAISSEATGRGGGGGYSATNVQVEGVDEADVTKTDGKFIYTIVDKKIIIASAVPAEDAAIVATISLEGRPQEFYINGDKLVVFGYDEVVYNPSQPVFRPMTPSVFAIVYDISDRTKPTAIKTLKFDGGYTSSRMIDKRVYLVTSNYNYYPVDNVSLPKVSENGKELRINPDVYYIDTPANFDATSVSVLNLDALEEPLHSNVYFMPSGQTIYASRGTLYLSYTKYVSEYEIRMAVLRDIMLNRLPEKERGQINAISSVDSFILNNDEKSYKINQIIENYIMRLPAAEQESVANEINTEFNTRFQNLYKQLETTVIHKISLNDGALSYEGSGEVSGHLLNQFSMDENNGKFRVATTRGQSWFIPFPIIAQKTIAPQTPVQESYNNIFVLDEKMNTE